VLASGNNTGGATLTATIADLAALDADDYRVRFDGSNFTVNSEQTGASVAFTGAGTPADPLVFGGVEVVVTGAPAAGDDFTLRPTANAAGSLALAVNSGREIAAAYPVRAAADGSNTGSGTIQIDGITDRADPALLNDMEIEFLDATTYQVNGAGSFSYTPGDAININGYDVVLSGSPQAGDRFNVESNVGGIGDNRNMLGIGELANQGLLDGGRATLNDAVGTLVSQAGISGREASRGLQAQGALLEQSQIRELEVSGVNLDEEAANLLQFQRSYEAAAQMIAVADSLFATLINAVRR
jgi:flagellar hook-associated protein 1 FlgK